MIQAPVTKPLFFVSEAVSSLECKLTKTQQATLVILLTSLFLLGSLTLSTIAAGWLMSFTINRLSHFLKYSPLSANVVLLAAIRWGLAYMGMQNATCRLIIDDTMEHHSKGCKTIANVYWLFDHVVGGCINARCIVFAYVVINECVRFPIGWRIYKRKGKNKWQLAIELVDEAIQLGLNIDVVMFDSWFCVSGMINALSKRKLLFIADLKSNHTAEFIVQDTSRKLRLNVNDVFKYASHLGISTNLGLVKQEGEETIQVLYETITMTLFIPAFNRKLRCVRSIDKRTRGEKILVTNALCWEAAKIISTYSQRWLIEEFFKNVKGFFGFEKACIRSEQAGALTLMLVSFADLLLSTQLWKNVHKSSENKLLTVSAIIAQAESENINNLLEVLDKDPERFREIITSWLRMVEKRQKKERKTRKILISTYTALTQDRIIEYQTAA
jgi:DDE superfamily endonuclease